MTPAVTAVALVAIILLVAVTAVYVIVTAPREDFADPADTADPDGTAFLAALHHEPVWTATFTLPAGDRPPAASVFATLARVRDGLLRLPPAPGPDDTAPLPVVLCELGGETVDQFVDRLFSEAAAT